MKFDDLVAHNMYDITGVYVELAHAFVASLLEPPAWAIHDTRFHYRHFGAAKLYFSVTTIQFSSWTLDRFMSQLALSLSLKAVTRHILGPEVLLPIIYNEVS